MQNEVVSILGIRIPPQQTSGSIRHHVVIERAADEVWPRIADGNRLQEWFPGLKSSVVNEDIWERRIVTQNDIEQVEEIVTIDSLMRRFQYRILPNFVVRKHLATVDVIELDPGRCLVTYSTDMEPRSFALAVGAGTRDALVELKRQVEADENPVCDSAPVIAESSVTRG
jgi:Polyketide cyclase / dehydrase and lipid transport